LIVDEFEKIFVECPDPTVRESFVNALCAAVDQEAALVVLGVRADFYGRCQAYEQLAPALKDRARLEPMTWAQLRKIIIAPAQEAGRPADPALVELLLSQVASLGYTTARPDPGALAWLAHALRETWQQSAGPTLTVRDYQAAGFISISEAITRRADDFYTALGDAEKRIVEQLLLRLVRLNTRSPDVPMWVPRDELLRNVSRDTGERLLEALGRARLLSLGTHGETDNGKALNVEIAHALLSWPTLVRLISEDRPWLHAYRALSADAQRWQERGSHARDRWLYNESQLAEIQEFITDPRYYDELSDDPEKKFLSASEEEVARVRQAAEKAGRRRKQGLAALLVLILLLGTSLIYAWHRANDSSELALANKLAGFSRSLVTRQPDAAMLTAVAAFHLKRLPETTSALLSAQDQFYIGQLSMPADGTIHTVMFSHDGQTLLTAGQRTARLWEVATHQPLAPDGGELNARVDGILDAEFSPQDQFVVTAGEDGIVRRWSVDERKPMAFPVGTGENRGLFAATFSHDGRFVATAGKDHSTHLLDADSLRDNGPQLPPGHVGPVHGVRFSPKDRFLVTVGEEEPGKNGTARLWDVARRQSLGIPLGGHTGHVNAAEFSPDELTVVTVGDDTTARLWDVATHQQIAVLEGHTRPINAVAFSPDGQMLLTGSDDGTARLWDIATHQQIAAFRGTSAITAVAFHPKGHTVATVGKDSIVRLWDTGGPILISSPPTVGYDVVFSPDGRILATAGADGVPRLWDPASRSPVAGPTDRHNGAIHAMAFNPEGILATAGADGTVRLWNTVTHRPIPSLSAQPEVWGVAFSRQGHLLAAVGNGPEAGKVRLWNTSTSPFTPLPGLIGPDRPTPPNGTEPDRLTGTVRAVAFSRDGQVLATAGDDATVRLWDMTSRKLIGKPLTGFAGAINKVALSPDGKLLVTASDDGYGFDRDGNPITEKGAARLWGWDVDKQKFQFLGTLPGHTGNVKTVAFSRDGRIVVTAGDDGTANLWDAATHDLLFTLAGHADAVYGAAFDPDAAMLATAGGDRTIRLWDLDVTRVTGHLCHIIGTVSRAQWDQILPDLPYQPTCGKSP
ncbi:MAG TPA: WD40 repeat domain-containing protein, partial [Pseudonocardiaceae bacterium]|nr:WD40 repeat domain-containing protein [Pseudonocardiaceae bacterium]